MKLTKEEKNLEKSLERHQWKKRGKSSAKRYQAVAKKQLKEMKKEARMNLRVSQETLKLVKTLASKEGLPYQSFVGSIVHKYATGALVERKMIEELQRLFSKKAS